MPTKGKVCKDYGSSLADASDIQQQLVHTVWLLYDQNRLLPGQEASWDGEAVRCL